VEQPEWHYFSMHFIYEKRCVFSSSNNIKMQPPPLPKKETKWEKFAKERGIGNDNQEKRSRKVWDENTGTWMYRHGYEKAGRGELDWPILEVKKNDDPYADPWEKFREEKRVKVEKNTVNRMRNEERAGNIPKGTATRTFKAQEQARGKNVNNKNRVNEVVVPSGVPVDLPVGRGKNLDPSGTVSGTTPQQRGKDLTKRALLATQRSTASLGKFDKMREGEPERRQGAGLKKRKFESSTDRNVVTTEADRGLKLLDKVMMGGGAQREKAKRNGSLAKGETAYDYEFDDGLGASSFKKKKVSYSFGL
jgi:regulator of ribosome biosynthesis